MNMRKAGCILLITATVCLGFLLKASAEETDTEFTATRTGQIVCYTDNVINVTAPEAGKLTIKICTDTSIYRTIEQQIPAGKNRIIWDGLGYNQERLYKMDYHMDIYLKGESGREYSTRIESYVFYYGQALQFALPSSDTAYMSDPEEWFLECKTIRDGTIQIEFWREGDKEAAYTFRRGISTGRISRYSFFAVTGKTKVETGSYRIRVFEISSPKYAIECSVHVKAEKPATEQVTVTGDIMPERGDSDSEIWNKMMQPAVVVDIKNTDHQQVYAMQDPDATILGTLHGQTQTLSVMEIDGEWARIEAWNHEEGERINGWVPLSKLKVVRPQTEYGLLVDKQEQTLTVFREGKRIGTVLVCTGRMEKKELYQETAAGSFLTGEHRVDYSTNGKKYDYVIQYDGGNLIHQIPYDFGARKQDFTEGRAFLGAKASHACIRVQAEPEAENGINAYWIWTHVPYHTRVVILDDPEERCRMKAILDETAPGTQMTENTRHIRPDNSQDAIVMTFGGDAVIGGREAYYRRNDSLMAYVDRYGMEYPFSGLQTYFGTDDLTSVNLECVLKADSTGENMKKTWRFRGLPEYTGILTEGSVELVNLANNHTIDYGEDGYESTVEAIGDSVAWCGPERPVTIEIKGHLIGFGGCRETTYKNDPGVIGRDIQALKDKGCEFIVYQCHWGTEYEPHRNALQEAMARTCIRAGADLVIGHHPHVVQGIEEISNVPVVYSLGNVCFGGTIPLSGYDAIIVRAEVTFEGGKPSVTMKAIPILTSSRAEEDINDFHPVIAEGADAERILRLVQRDSGNPDP